MGECWRWALVSPDWVASSRMVCVSTSVNLPLHYKVQKFFSGTGWPGWSGKRAVKRWWCGCGNCGVCLCGSFFKICECQLDVAVVFAKIPHVCSDSGEPKNLTWNMVRMQLCMNDITIQCVQKNDVPYLYALEISITCKTLYISTICNFWAPLPLVDIIWAMMIVWWIRGEIIRTVLCCVVYDSCTQWYTHIWAVLKDECWFRFRTDRQTTLLGQ